MEIIIKDLLTGLEGNSEFLFPKNLDVSLDFVSGNIEILGKQNSLFISGPVIQCLFLWEHPWEQAP